MKKQIKSVAILLTLVLGMISFAGKLFLHTANATYVEGSITKDTLWTLVDSPFVVSNNILIYPNATLTIEPGTEVKFGGSFSIVVEGKILANGTEDRLIRFTSNKYAPQPGDWNTISFTGAGLSFLINCIIEYGTNGTSVTNSNVEAKNSEIARCKENGVAVTNGDMNIRNSNISYCLQNGITATASNLTVQENAILQNDGSGIYVTGNGHVTVQANTIIANREGIALSGNQTSGVNISQNVIAANQEIGLLINAGAHSNIVITNNSISSNKNGFYISTLASTYIADNAIAYNENGFYYGRGNHKVYHNDIYGNKFGMDVQSGCTIDAEYNYWGDPSGPYHVSLNPAGRGDAFGSNETNVDFIFFLTKPVGHINDRPTAKLLADRILVPPNGEVMFFATESSDNGKVDRYFFDLDDGSNSGWTTLSVFAHKYPAIGTYHTNLTVMDDFGATSSKVAATISVQNLPSLHTSIDVSKSAVREGENVSITVHVTDGTMAIENANVTMFSIKGGNFTPPIGVTNATGIFATTFTVPDVAQFSNIRVIARASMSEYSDGSGYEYLEVLPFLSVQAVPGSSRITSEGSTPVTIIVTSNGQPVADAHLTMSSYNGDLSSTTGTTNLDGVFSLVFTAPLTTEGLNAIITVNARKDSFVEGFGSANISIEPKILSVRIFADPPLMISEAMANLTVSVEYDGAYVEETDINVMVENGTLSQLTGITDISGSVRFIFTAPAVKTQTTVAIAANASKHGYASGQNQILVTVNPRTFNITIKADRNSTEAEGTANVTVSVVCIEDGQPVGGALITMSASDGNFTDPVGVTDSKGYCSFVFIAPQTTAQITAILTANVTKSGYVDGINQMTMDVVPRAVAETGGGLPLMIILMILIPVIIVVVVVVLVKLKIITFSSQEET